VFGVCLEAMVRSNLGFQLSPQVGGQKGFRCLCLAHHRPNWFAGPPSVPGYPEFASKTITPVNGRNYMEAAAVRASERDRKLCISFSCRFTEITPG